MTTRDPSAMAITVEGARLALRQAGPHSGLHGPAAADVDRKLSDIVIFLNEIGENRRARMQREGRG